MLPSCVLRVVCRARPGQARPGRRRRMGPARPFYHPDVTATVTAGTPGKLRGFRASLDGWGQPAGRACAAEVTVGRAANPWGCTRAAQPGGDPRGCWPRRSHGRQRDTPWTSHTATRGAPGRWAAPGCPARSPASPPRRSTAGTWRSVGQERVNAQEEPEQEEPRDVGHWRQATPRGGRRGPRGRGGPRAIPMALAGSVPMRGRCGRPPGAGVGPWLVRAQARVGFVDLLGPPFRLASLLGVPRKEIGVPPLHQPAVRPLDLLRGCAGRHPENLVVAIQVIHGCTSQFAGRRAPTPARPLSITPM